MNILYFILGKANPNRANGVNQVIYWLARDLTYLGHTVKVVGLSKSNDKSYEVINRGNFEVEVYKNFGCKCKQRLKVLIENSDIVHLHAVWNVYNVRIGRLCEKMGKPYVMTAHGGYKQYIMSKSLCRKTLFHVLFAKHLYEKAAFVHALTREESSEILKKCPKANIKVIPNGIDYTQVSLFQYKLKNRKQIVLGYLGRISKEKNLHNLCRAFLLLPNNIKERIQLNIIGPYNENDSYFKSLLRLISSNNLTSYIHFLGPQYAKNKFRSLVELDIYIHPSLTEGLSISLLEVLAVGVPSIITRTSDMTYYYNSNSFIMTEPTAQDMSRAIEEMIDRQNEWEQFSFNSRKLVQEKFTWETVTEHLCKEYIKCIK